MPTLRLLSVDARTTGGRAELAGMISDADADVVCLHGAPHVVRWRARIAALARRSARVVVVPGGPAAGANAVLSTLAVDVVLTRERRLGGSWLSPLGAALTVLRCGGVQFALVSATLAGNAAQRLGQANELQAAIGRLVPGDPPVIVSALGSDRPGTAAWQALAGSRVGVADRLFVDERIAVADSRRVGGTELTPAVLAVLNL